MWGRGRGLVLGRWGCWRPTLPIFSMGVAGSDGWGGAKDRRFFSCLFLARNYDLWVALSFPCVLSCPLHPRLPHASSSPPRIPTTPFSADHSHTCSSTPREGGYSWYSGNDRSHLLSAGPPSMMRRRASGLNGRRHFYFCIPA